MASHFQKNIKMDQTCWCTNAKRLCIFFTNSCQGLCFSISKMWTFKKRGIVNHTTKSLKLDVTLSGFPTSHRDCRNLNNSSSNSLRKLEDKSHKVEGLVWFILKQPLDIRRKSLHFGSLVSLSKWTYRIFYQLSKATKNNNKIWTNFNRTSRFKTFAESNDVNEIFMMSMSDVLSAWTFGNRNHIALYCIIFLRECDLLPKCRSDNLSNSLRPDIFCPEILCILYTYIASNYGSTTFEFDERRPRFTKRKRKGFLTSLRQENDRNIQWDGQQLQHYHPWK